ncbi:MAG: GAF and ANTAR domain-containing protein [Acidimicrobiales bacterium]
MRCGRDLPVRGRAAITAASSDPMVVELDRAQFGAGEGPCLDAVAARHPTYAEDLAGDSRWPTFGPSASAAGIRSLLALPLSSQRSSALNLYAHLPDAFGATDRAKGLIFATLAGIALDAAADRADEERLVANLKAALRTRELIGQAQGILIERERITADQAFEVLRRASQDMNLKLREVAQSLVDTGETPGTSSGAERR